MTMTKWLRTACALTTMACAVPLLALTPSEGCGRSTLASGQHRLDDQGLSRSFSLQVPAGYRADAPAPLILWFHGWGGNGQEMLDEAEVTALADARGYIVAAPRGLGSGAPDHRNNSWSFEGSTSGLDGDGVNAAVPGDTAAICDPAITPEYRYASCRAGEPARAQNSCAWTHCQADDIDFALALLGVLQRGLCIDRDRVYAAGGSNGGMFTWQLAQDRRSAPLLRAIAPVIGLPHRGYLAGAGRETPLPVLLITGTEDTTVPPGAWEDDSFTTTRNDSDRFYYTGASAIMRRWSAAHGCALERAAPFDDRIAETDCRSYCNSRAGWPPVLDCRAQMGHDYGLGWSWRLLLDFFDRQAPRAAGAR